MSVKVLLRWIRKHSGGPSLMGIGRMVRASSSRTPKDAGFPSSVVVPPCLWRVWGGKEKVFRVERVSSAP